MRITCFYFLLAACACFLVSFSPYPALAESPDGPRQHLEQALEREIDLQKEIQDWSQKKQELLHRILQLKSEADWHKYRTAKYREYIRNQKETIAGLVREKENMGALSRKLEPYLDRVVADLAAFVANDLDFLPRERENRIASLRDVLGSHDKSLSDKLGRVLQALQIEASYGRGVEARSATVKRDGREIRVQVLRLGRVAKFYRSPDGEYAGRWTRSSGEWEPISPDYAEAIHKAVRIARDETPAELVELPVKGEKR
ncbi:MAG: DUF3450 domain-containing protein [Desulfohalobiaceae bacterium]